jgi:hypothetical protein
VFGINGELKNNLYLFDDHKLLYSAGHNIVVYNLEDKSQFFLSGTNFHKFNIIQAVKALRVSPALLWLHRRTSTWQCVKDQREPSALYMTSRIRERRRRYLSRRVRITMSTYQRNLSLVVSLPRMRSST